MQGISTSNILVIHIHMELKENLNSLQPHKRWKCPTFVLPYWQARPRKIRSIPRRRTTVHSRRNIPSIKGVLPNLSVLPASDGSSLYSCADSLKSYHHVQKSLIFAIGGHRKDVLVPFRIHCPVSQRFSRVQQC